MSHPLTRVPEEWQAWDKSYPLRLPRLFSTRAQDIPFDDPQLDSPERLTDQYGLAWSLYRNYPERSRYYVSIALTHIGFPKNASPHAAGVGTIPELVIYGGLLRRGYIFQGLTKGSFYFQSNQLGGRDVPGGAVVDFLVWVGGEKVGVRVQGKYHALNNPFFVGRQKVEEDRLQLTRLAARAGFSRIVDVNSSPFYALEIGPDALVEREFRRIEMGR